MSTTQDYIEYIFDQIDDSWNKRYKKMFGEYMVYINDKPLLLVCDNTVFIRKLECIKELIPQESTGFPYEGAREHFILDIEDNELVDAVIARMEKETSVPVRRKRRNG